MFNNNNFYEPAECLFIKAYSWGYFFLHSFLHLSLEREVNGKWGGTLYQLLHTNLVWSNLVTVKALKNVPTQLLK